jgi:hypothetical protein
MRDWDMSERKMEHSPRPSMKETPRPLMKGTPKQQKQGSHEVTNQCNMRSHHPILMIVIMIHLQREVSSSRKELRQVLLAKPAPETTKQGIKSLVIQTFLLIIRKLEMISKVYGIENHVCCVA